MKETTWRSITVTSSFNEISGSAEKKVGVRGDAPPPHNFLKRVFGT